MNRKVRLIFKNLYYYGRYERLKFFIKQRGRYPLVTSYVGSAIEITYKTVLLKEDERPLNTIFD